MTVAILHFARFSYEVRPEVGRKAFFGSCHCLPVLWSAGARACHAEKEKSVPFFLMPSGFATDGLLSTFDSDMLVVDIGAVSIVTGSQFLGAELAST